MIRYGLPFRQMGASKPYAVLLAWLTIFSLGVDDVPYEPQSALTIGGRGGRLLDASSKLSAAHSRHKLAEVGVTRSTVRKEVRQQASPPSSHHHQALLRKEDGGSSTRSRKPAAKPSAEAAKDVDDAKPVADNSTAGRGSGGSLPMLANLGIPGANPNPFHAPSELLGETGNPGPQGETGEPGAQGPSGARGKVGATGIQGKKGLGVEHLQPKRDYVRYYHLVGLSLFNLLVLYLGYRRLLSEARTKDRIDRIHRFSKAEEFLEETAHLIDNKKQQENKKPKAKAKGSAKAAAKGGAEAKGAAKAPAKAGAPAPAEEAGVLGGLFG
jgi:hypothetical protein